jgi:hypothetical protein
MGELSDREVKASAVRRAEERKELAAVWKGKTPEKVIGELVERKAVGKDYACSEPWRCRVDEEKGTVAFGPEGGDARVLDLGTLRLGLEYKCRPPAVELRDMFEFRSSASHKTEGRRFADLQDDRAGNLWMVPYDRFPGEEGRIEGPEILMKKPEILLFTEDQIGVFEEEVGAT